jgi:hypothetical protein
VSLIIKREKNSDLDTKQSDLLFKTNISSTMPEFLFN